MASTTTMDDSLVSSLEKVRHQATSTLVHQKRPANLLLAIEGTLTEQGTALTPVAYFAALLSTIQQLAENDGDSETLAAGLYLFAIVLPCVQAAVLRSRMGTMLEIFPPLVIAQGDQAGTVKSLFAIMQAIFLAMDGSTLSSLAAKQAYNTLLAFIVDARPKVRRKAQDTICAMLADPPAPSVKHPYATRTADFVMESLKDALKEGKKGGKRKAQEQNAGNASEEASRAIALCALIKSIGKDWPSDAIAPLCSLLLSLPRLSNPFLTGASYDILETLFSKSSDSFEEGKVEEVLEAVLAARPSGSGSVDERILPGWLGTVEHGFVAYAKSNPEGCDKALLSSFNGVLAYLTSSAQPVRAAATSTLNALSRYCISNEEITYTITNLTSSEEDARHPLRPICNTLLAALRDFKFQAVAMPHLLSVISSLISRLRQRSGAGGKSRTSAAALLLVEHIKLAGQLRGSDSFEYRDAAELVLGSATEVCGPEFVISLLPLNLDLSSNSPENPGRAWLLPIFRTKITNTRLKHFTTYFVSLSETMFGKFRDAEMRSEVGETEAEKKRAGIEAKVYEAVVQQIWALFPGYCDLPVDLPEAFDKKFCEILSNVLYSQAHLRPPIFRGLQLLVERNRTITASASSPEVLLESFGVNAEAGKKNLQLLASLAPNLLAVMFNVFSKSSKEGRGYVLDCISAYLSVLTPKDLVGTYNKIQTLLLQGLKASANDHKPGASESSVPQTMLDFLVQLVPYLPDADTANQLLKLVLSEQILQHKDTAVQKKAYRILVRFCEAGGVVGQAVVRDNLEGIVEELVEKNTAVAASAKKDRTVLLSTIVPLLPNDKLHLIPSIIPEAVLATKEANEAARAAAYDLLVGLAQKMSKGGIIKRNLVKGAEEADDSMAEDSAEASVQEYITMVAAGLAGTSPHMISATITALSRLLFEFHNELMSDTINELVSTILVFLGSANREIVKSSVGFVKVAIVCLSPVDVRPHLPKLVPALLDWSHEHKNHFKLNIRHIFERLIRKFGYEEIDKLTGESDKKLLSNIRKRQQRSKRKKDQHGDAGNSDNDQVLRPKAERNAYEDALYGSEDEAADSDDDEGAPAQTGNKQRTGQQPPLRKNAIGRRKGDQNVQYIREGENPLDLLDEKMLGQISRNDPQLAEARRLKRETRDANGGDSKAYKTDFKSGKLVFNEDDEADNHGDGGDGGMAVDGDSTNAYLEAIRGEDGFRRDAKGKVKFNKSTKRARAQLEEDELLEDVKDRLAGLGVAQAGQRSTKAKRTKENIGSEFKARKAGGDVKKAGGPNPYAYVPLGDGKKREGLNIVGKGRRK